jgi:hypothetical protein
MVDSVFFIVIASFLSVFDIKGDGTDGGPDKYPFTGCSITCGHRLLMVLKKVGKLNADFLAFRALSPAPSPRGIEGQKSSSLPIRRHNELLRLFLSCVPFLPNERVLCCGGLVSCIVSALLTARTES